MEAQEVFLKNTAFIDFSHPAIQQFTQEVVGDCKIPKDKAVKIYLAVRDGWQYTATRISFREQELKASSILQQPSGHCIEKAVLMVACCRAAGIPARLCLSKVKNHIAAENMEKLFGTDELVPHGYLEVFLNDKWVKATPAFNASLCEKLGVAPLEFDGQEDSLFQEYSKNGSVFMEYLDDYGAFEDVPLDFIISLMRAHYPVLIEKGYQLGRGGLIDLG